MKIPTTKEELLALTLLWENAHVMLDSLDYSNCERLKAWNIITVCEDLFDKADCWLDENGNFCKEEASPFLSGS